MTVVRPNKRPNKRPNGVKLTRKTRAALKRYLANPDPMRFARPTPPC